MKPVNEVAPLPYPGSDNIAQLDAFDKDMRRALVDYLFTVAFRLNNMLPKDGSEPMTGGLTINSPGTLRVENSTDISSITQTNQPVQIGPYSGANLMMDGNEVQARTNGAVSNWFLQLFGGNITFGDIASILELNGGKVKFPASQQASTDANTLDDYEEGTFTPILKFGGASTGITYSVQTGSYVKIGTLVFCQARIILTNKGSATGQAQLIVPFANNGLSHSYNPITIGYYESMVGLGGAFSGYIETNSVDVNLITHAATGVVFLNETYFNNGSGIIYTAVYRAAS